MASNPVLAYGGPDGPAVPVTLQMMDQTTLNTRGILTILKHTPATVEAPWAEAGNVVWVSLPAPHEPTSVDFVIPDRDSPGYAALERYRVIYGDRESGSDGYDTARLILQDDPTPGGNR